MGARSISIVLMTATAASCGFEPGSAGTTTPERDASAPSEDAAIRDDAAGATADAPTAALTWMLAETMTIQTFDNGTTPPIAMSSMALSNGVTYKLIAKGTFDCTFSGTDADAEYWDIDASPDNLTAGIDFGLGVEDTTIDGTKIPASWGAYTAANQYEMMYVGKGSRLSAVLYDSQYDNNSGTLTLEIHELK